MARLSRCSAGTEYRGKFVLTFLMFLEKLKKPSREMLVNWVSDSFLNLEFDENVFFRVIMRNPHDLSKHTKTQEAINEENELVFENEYEFITLE